MSELHDVVDQIIVSLAEHPGDWKIDHYTAEHKSGLRVWMANGHYGMAIQVPDGRYSHREFGGVTGWSVFFGAIIPWRRRLRNAVLAEEARRAPEPVLVVASRLLAA